MTTDKYHAVERVADVRPDYALPLNAPHRKTKRKTVSGYVDPFPHRAYEILLAPEQYPDSSVKAAQRLADLMAGDVPLVDQLDVLLRIAKSKGYKPKAGLGDVREAFLRAKEKKERAARKAKTELTEAVKDDIRTRLLKGQTTRYIADKVGINIRTVQRLKKLCETAVAPHPVG